MSRSVTVDAPLVSAPVFAALFQIYVIYSQAMQKTCEALAWRNTKISDVTFSTEHLLVTFTEPCTWFKDKSAKDWLHCLTYICVEKKLEKHMGLKTVTNQIFQWKPLHEWLIYNHWKWQNSVKVLHWSAVWMHEIRKFGTTGVIAWKTAINLEATVCQNSLATLTGMQTHIPFNIILLL